MHRERHLLGDIPGIAQNRTLGGPSGLKLTNGPQQYFLGCDMCESGYDTERTVCRCRNSIDWRFKPKC